MITGAHSIVFSSNPDADRAFFRDTLGLTHVDVGGGWLIFGLPPSEVAVHGTEEGGAGSHELYLMTDDVQSFIEQMQERELSCAEVQDEGWGLLTHVTLPGGGKIGVYEPRHARPESSASNGAAKKRAPKKAAKKKKAPARAKPIAKASKAKPKAKPKKRR
jgi:hypothetical protein